MAVLILKDERMDYSNDAPYHPQEAYPEYPFKDVSGNNSCYDGVRKLLYGLNLDREHFGKSSWNPLGDVISPGNNVFVKPNFVSHQNEAGSIDAVVTNGSVIRAVLDYVHIALKGKGSITIGDAPYINTDFDRVKAITGMDRIASYYAAHSDIKLNVIDLRKEMGQIKHGRIKKVPLQGDPLGYSVIDLKENSEHVGLAQDACKFRVVYYDRTEMLKHHTGDKNEYFIANSVLNADVVINIPKLKTHAKTGISCALKCLVGINGIKDWLPHHRAGPYERGGDEYHYKDFRKDLYCKLKDYYPASRNALGLLPLRAVGVALFTSKYVHPFHDDINGGSWYGNDTLPRTICDLNKILFYADRSGVMKDTAQRKMLIIVDGIVAGEKEGPMSNTAKKCGMLVAGYNPVEVDIACSLAMGFDPCKLPTIKHALGIRKYPIYDGDPRAIEITSDRCRTLDGVHDAFNCALVPPKGWAGHIEYEKSLASPTQASQEENVLSEPGKDKIVVMPTMR